MRSKVTGSRSKVTQRSDHDVAQLDPKQRYSPDKILRSKVTQRSDHGVAQLGPLRNIPAKFELPKMVICVTF